MAPAIEWTTESGLIKRIPIAPKTTTHFGRAPANDFVMLHPSVSRKHATLTLDDDGAAYLTDLASAHGTFFSSYRLPPNLPMRLIDDVPIRLGAAPDVLLPRGMAPSTGAASAAEARQPEAPAAEPRRESAAHAAGAALLAGTSLPRSADVREMAAREREDKQLRASVPLAFGKQSDGCGKYAV